MPSLNEFPKNKFLKIFMFATLFISIQILFIYEFQTYLKNPPYSYQKKSRSISSMDPFNINKYGSPFHIKIEKLESSDTTEFTATVQSRWDDLLKINGTWHLLKNNRQESLPIRSDSKIAPGETLQFKIKIPTPDSKYLNKVYFEVKTQIENENLSGSGVMHLGNRDIMEDYAPQMKKASDNLKKNNP